MTEEKINWEEEYQKIVNDDKIFYTWMEACKRIANKKPKYKPRKVVLEAIGTTMLLQSKLKR